MIELKKSVYQRINDAHDYKTYDGIAAEKATFPYVVYKVTPIESTETGRDDYTLEISCWDKSDATSHMRVTELADSIRNALVNWQHLDEHNLVFVTRPSLGYIPDPDATIKRYNVTCILKTYRR